MKRRNIKRMCAALLCMAFFLATCSDQGADESSRSESSANNLSESSSTTSIGNNPSSDQSSNVDNPESSDNHTGSSTQVVESSSSRSLPVEEKPDMTIIVKKLDLVEAQSVTITDKETTDKILSFVETMFESDYNSHPSTGVTIIDVSITGKDGTTKEYEFLEQEVDGYGLAKDLQHPDAANTWYNIDPEAFSYLLNLLK